MSLPFQRSMHRKTQAHLARSARALSAVSPSISAHLQTVRQAHLLNNPQHSITSTRSSFQQDTCTACGTIQIPGWTCNVSLYSHKSLEDGGDESNKRGEQSIILRCTACSRERIVKCDESSEHGAKIPAVRSKKRKHAKLEEAAEPESQAAGISPDRAPDSANKERKEENWIRPKVKSRRKGGASGLKGLVVRNKAEAAAAAAAGRQGFGLGLMDLMKRDG